MTDKGNTHESVQDYYGKQLQKTEDLKTGACTTSCGANAKMPQYLRKVLGKIHDDVHAKYYGCGIVVPKMLRGMHVLDLGCGAGRDVYAISALVGPTGSASGVDMTPEMLNVAKEHVAYHMKTLHPEAHAKDAKFSNVHFHSGLIEKLDAIPELKDNSLDIIVSNCVINLCVDKKSALSNAYRMLKQGGEMYFSDVYSDRRVPKALLEDPVLYGECISGALYWDDFLALCKEIGFRDVRVMNKPPKMPINNAEIEKKIEGYNFYSVTVRLFKDAGLEYEQEDYAQSVVYRGYLSKETGEMLADDENKANGEMVFELDYDHKFTYNEKSWVSGNTYLMLKHSRFAPLFTFDPWNESDRGDHYAPYKFCDGSDTSATAKWPFENNGVAEGCCGGDSSQKGGCGGGGCC